MDDPRRIEEPPLMPRSKVVPAKRSSPGPFMMWRTRPATERPDPEPKAKRPPKSDRNLDHGASTSGAGGTSPGGPGGTVDTSGTIGTSGLSGFRLRGGSGLSRKRLTSESESSGANGPGVSGRLVLVSVLVVTVVGVQGWTIHRLSSVRTDLVAAGSGLEEARASLGMLWDATKRLDQDQLSRLSQLADSIRSVFAYAQGEVRLWETAFYAQEKRLNDSEGKIARNGDAITRLNTSNRSVHTRLEEIARGDAQQLGRLDALERQDRSHVSAVEALARRTQTQEANVRDVSTTLLTLRQSLNGLDAELTGLEQQVAGYSDLGTRIDRLNGWIEGFRRAGLSGETVQSRLSALADELRRVRMRVDSLRPVRSRIAEGPR